MRGHRRPPQPIHDESPPASGLDVRALEAHRTGGRRPWVLKINPCDYRSGAVVAALADSLITNYSGRASAITFRNAVAGFGSWLDSNTDVTSPLDLTSEELHDYITEMVACSKSTLASYTCILISESDAEWSSAVLERAGAATGGRPRPAQSMPLEPFDDGDLKLMQTAATRVADDFWLRRGQALKTAQTSPEGSWVGDLLRAAVDFTLTPDLACAILGWPKPSEVGPLNVREVSQREDCPDRLRVALRNSRSKSGQVTTKRNTPLASVCRWAYQELNPSSPETFAHRFLVAYYSGIEIDVVSSIDPTTVLASDDKVRFTATKLRSGATRAEELPARRKFDSGTWLLKARKATEALRQYVLDTTGEVVGLWVATGFAVRERDLPSTRAVLPCGTLPVSDAPHRLKDFLDKCDIELQHGTADMRRLRKNAKARLQQRLMAEDEDPLAAAVDHTATTLMRHYTNATGLDAAAGNFAVGVANAIVALASPEVRQDDSGEETAYGVGQCKDPTDPPNWSAGQSTPADDPADRLCGIAPFGCLACGNCVLTPKHVPDIHATLVLLQDAADEDPPAVAARDYVPLIQNGFLALELLTGTREVDRTVDTSRVYLPLALSGRKVHP